MNKNKAQLYDEFNDYVVNSVRNKHNPELSLQPYDNTQEPGPTHFSIVLQNVTKGDRSLYEKIEAFKEGTKLDTQEHIKTGGTIYIAHVPFKSNKKKSIKKNDNDDNEEPTELPSLNLLYFYVLLVLITIIVAFLKTDRKDWKFIF